ncbi:unnamed protein product, partial [Rotaria sp. Silwood1]
EESTKRQQHQSHSILTKFSTNFKRPTTISASAPTESKDNSSISNTTTDHDSSNVDNRSIRRQPFFNVTRVSLTRSPHQESYAKMQQEDEEDFDKPSISFISDKRTPQHQQHLKMYNIDEDVHISDDNYNNNSSHINPSHNDDGEEMILTAAKLSPHIISSPTTDNKSYISSTPIKNISRC